MTDKLYICSLCNEKVLAREAVNHHILTHKNQQIVKLYSVE